MIDIDVDVSLVSRMVYTGSVDKVVAAGVRPSHFADQDMRDVFEMCAQHYRTFVSSPSLEWVKQRFPDVQLRVVTDDISALIDEFRVVAGERAAITKWQDIGRDIDKAQAGDLEMRRKLPEIFMEHAREMATEIPGSNMSRLGEMHARMLSIRDQQRTGIVPGYKPCVEQLRPYVYTYKPTQVVVHCGVSGVGKTTGLVRDGISSFEQGARVLMVSLEMDDDEIWEMFDAHFGKLSRKNIERRNLSDDDYKRYEQASRRLEEAKGDIGIICPPGGVTIDHVAGYVQQFNPDVLLVDYISLLKPLLKTHARHEAVSDISASLKQLARTFKIVVMVAAQNNREAIEVGPKEDNIADSISVWRDCNVMIGYHQDPVMASQMRVEGRLIKNRRGNRGPAGESGYFEFFEYWDRDTLTFESWSDGRHAYATKAGLGPVGG